MTTPHDFAIALLSGLGLPITTNNLTSIVSAEAAEGGFTNNSATYNPLNVTTSVAGSQTASGFGGPGQANIQAYPTWASGLAATISTLKNGFYPDILAALQASSSPTDTLAVWAKNKNYGWSLTPSVNTSYGSQTFPQGPSSIPLVVPGVPNSASAPLSLGKIGVGAGLLYLFWQLYKMLGR